MSTFYAIRLCLTIVSKGVRLFMPFIFTFSTCLCSIWDIDIILQVIILLAFSIPFFEVFPIFIDLSMIFFIQILSFLSFCCFLVHFSSLCQTGLYFRINFFEKMIEWLCKCTLWRFSLALILAFPVMSWHFLLFHFVKLDLYKAIFFGLNTFALMSFQFFTIFQTSWSASCFLALNLNESKISLNTSAFQQKKLYYFKVWL